MQRALQAGQFKFHEADQDFPARIWYHDQATGQLWIGYCINSVAGEYKGWPILEDERLAVFD